MKKKMVYITGCCGFIGSYIATECLKRGWYVRGVDKMTYASNMEVLNKLTTSANFTFQKTDINDLEFLYDCDYIINTAAETHVCNSIVKSEDFIHSNINGVYHLLELIRNYRGMSKPMLIHFSTDEVYGDIHKGSHKETDKLNPSNPYSATKAAADQLILAWARTYNINYLIVRPTNNYGIYQYVEKLIPKSIKCLQLGRKIPLHQKGKPTRVWLHAQDTANAIMTLIDKEISNDIYNISGNIEQSNILTVDKILREFFKNDCVPELRMLHIDDSCTRPGQDVRYSLNDDKLRSLGWDNMCDFDEELPKIIDYYKERFIW